MEKLCVYLICPYVIPIKGQKENINLKSVTVIDSVTGWVEITQYHDKREIKIINLVETTCLNRYPGQQKSCMTKN